MSEDTEAKPQYEDWTAGAVTDFCDYLSEKNYVASQTATSWKTAVTRVVELAEGDGWENVDLQNVNEELLFTRFENAARSDFTGGTIKAYEKRFKKARSEYEAWVAAPGEYSPDIRRRAVGKDEGSSSSQKAKSKSSTSAKSSSQNGHSNGNGAAVIPVSEDALSYPFPVRPGIVGQITLPSDLTPDEAERVAGFIRALAVQPSRPADSEASEESAAA